MEWFPFPVKTKIPTLCIIAWIKNTVPVAFKRRLLRRYFWHCIGSSIGGNGIRRHSWAIISLLVSLSANSTNELEQRWGVNLSLQRVQESRTGLWSWSLTLPQLFFFFFKGGVMGWWGWWWWWGFSKFCSSASVWLCSPVCFIVNWTLILTALVWVLPPRYAERDRETDRQRKRILLQKATAHLQINWMGDPIGSDSALETVPI